MRRALLSRWLSVSGITLIAQMGYDAPRPFVPMVVCIGDCACCLNRRLRRFSQMGCDAPPLCPDGCLYRGLRVLSELGWAGLKDGQDAAPLCPDGCLYRGLRVLSEPRITLIAQMGYDAPRPFVPMVVCIGDCGCCLNRGLRGWRRWAMIFGVLWMVSLR